MEYVPDNYDQFLKYERELDEQEESNEQFISDNREL
jgi:hypothetical protein